MTIAQLPPFDLRVVYPWMQPDAIFAAHFEQGQYWLDDAKGPIAASSLLATTRSSSIVLPDSAGVFQTLGINTLPRTDRGLYANGQVTNLLLWSQDFDNAAWTKIDTTITQSGVLDPAGSNFAFEIRKDNTGTYNNVFVQTGGGAAPSGSYFHAILVKKSVGTNIRIRLSDNVTGQAVASLNLDNGSTGVVSSGTFTNVISGSIQLTDGWYLFWLSGTQPAGQTQWAFGIYQQNQNDRVFLAFPSRTNSNFLTPYVPTTSAPATLFASDIRAVQGIRPSNSQAEPFAGWEAAGLDGAFGGKNIVTIDRLNAAAARFITGAGVDADNLTKLIFDTDNRFKLIVRKSGVDEVTLQTGAVSATGDKTIEWQAKPGDYAIAATGVAGDTDSDSETLPAGVTTLRVGSNFGVLNPFNGWIEELQILKVAA